MAATEFVSKRIGPDRAVGPVGHYRNAKSFQRFSAVYRECMELLPEPSEDYTVSSSFGTVRAYRFGESVGSAVPLVLLPGRSSCTPLWLPNLRGLMQGRAVYSIDSIGEPGCSTQDRPIRGAADQATWAAETIEGLGLTTANLMGVSIGGWLAIQVAIHRPERVNSVIALDPAMTFGRVTGKAILASMGALIPGMPAGLRSACSAPYPEASGTRTISPKVALSRPA